MMRDRVIYYRDERSDDFAAVTGASVLPDGIPEGFLPESLTSLMHGHVADYCVYSIFEKTNPDEAAQYLARATSELERIKTVLELRTAPVRRPADRYY